MRHFSIYFAFILIIIFIHTARVQAVEYCFGLPDNDPGVCSGNGTCIATDTCACLAGYTGPQCSVYQCYGTDYDDPGVCSGNGTCVATDTCACLAGYTGPQCSMYQCYGTDYDDPGVCSYNGVCVAVDTCLCDQAWTADTCDTCYYQLRGDINKDCIADLLDFAELADVWLIDCIEDPNDVECIEPE